MTRSATIRLTAVPGERISVGLNYPWAWNKWGAYFGSGERTPGDCPAYGVWLDNLDRNLGTIEDCVSVVRIFLFGNFANLGSTRPGVGPPGARRWRRRPWRAFVPPETVSGLYAEQLDRMLRIFGKHGVKVIPSLTDAVGFAQGPTAPCRTDILLEPSLRAWFLERVVDPLLAVSADADNARAVFAWEVMNEPGQITDTLAGRWLRRTSYPIPRDTMNAFLSSVAARIAARGFASTVGHWWAGDLDLFTGDLPQFHHYPQSVSWAPGLLPSRLPPQSQTRAFVGELASDEVQRDQRASTPWPELPRELQSGDGRLCTDARLRLLEARGYGLGLLWPDLPRPRRRAGERADPRVAFGPVDYEPHTAADEPLHYSQGVIDGIRGYVGR